MKQFLLFFLISFNHSIFSQQILQKTFETNLNEIDIETFGLDEIKIINTDADKIEVNLYDENPNSHSIYTKESSDILKISFQLSFYEEPDVFRKYITKRLHRASVIIKLPKNKQITLHGDAIDVISKSYKGNLYIYINKGLVKLHQVKGNVILKLFQGNVFGEIPNTNVSVISNNGKIKVNDTLYLNNYQKQLKNSENYFRINSIHANTTLQYIFK